MNSTQRMNSASSASEPGAVVWLTGLSGAGKSTIAEGVVAALRQDGRWAVLIDGDALRTGLCSDLGFSQHDRHENVRRAAAVASLVARSGAVAVVALISPFAADREAARAQAHTLRFIEIYCSATLAICEARDPKGLYRRARAGHIAAFTGIDSPYEPPAHPDVTLDTATTTPQACIARVMTALSKESRSSDCRSGGRFSRDEANER